MSASVTEALAGIVGAKHVITDADAMVPYLKEPRGLFKGKAQAVVRPGSVAEVSALMKWASETGATIVPQGGNTGMVGGQVPVAEGREIVLSLQRLDKVRAVDAAGDTMTVEAGVILQKAQEAAEAAGRLFPLSLASEGSCTVGGNLSANAGGTAVIAYGNARELCLGLEVVLPDGRVWNGLRQLRKDNTGYDLKNLFVGAEGTLGVITAAVLKLYPQPKGREVAWVGLESPEAALALFSLASDRAGSSLTAFELMIDEALSFVLKHAPNAAAPLASRHPWHVLIEISSGRSAADASALIEEILAEGFEAGLAGDAALSSSLAQANELWRLRESMSEAQKPEGASIKHDVSVPVASIPAFIDEAWRAATSVEPAARLVCFGHMGDGNLHYNISQPAGGDPAAFLALYRRMNDAVHAVVRAYNGSISAEHGIGRMKRDELIATAPPLAIDLMRRVKAAFDPAGIMNPNKLI